MGGVRERTGKISCMLVALAVVLATRTPEVRAASFYGTSYIHSSLTDSYQEADIQFSFKTSRAKGLLLMVAGARDYSIIQLKSGYIQVILELNGVDRSIKSPMKEKLNDQTWHHIHVVFTDISMFLSIDNNFQREISFGGTSRALRFEDGIFIGGTGNLERAYIDQAGRFFRGCIENVQYNRVPIVNGTQLHDNVELFDVTLGCTSEFEAAPDAAISFVKDTAYVVYPRWQVGEFGSFACWIKTTASLGLLVYNGESGADSSFVAAEIVDGRVRVLLSHGTDVIDFTSQHTINDAMWHWVKISISQSQLMISIDYEPELLIYDVPLPDPINLGGMMNVGGVVLKARAEAYQSNLNSITDISTGGSFNGCIRDIEVNNQKQVLADSRVTHGIEIGCVFDFPCIQDDPCSPGEACIETGPGSMDFLCESDYDEEEDDEDIITTGAPDTTQQQRGAFSTSPLRLQEGGRKVITSENIHLNVDFRSLQVRESQILFRIITRPKYGAIENDVLRRDDDSLEFTLLDLNENKIWYVHDASENYQDETSVSVEVLDKENVPTALKGNSNITLLIYISPINDPPAIVMAENNVLKMIQHNKRPIRYNFIQAVDPDNTTSELSFIIINQGRNVGQLEFIDIPGRPIYSFTQHDIDQEIVVYSHTGPLTKSRIVFKLSDGLKETNLLSFRVDAMPLMLEVVNNSAARLNPRSMVPITSRNLYTRTNDPDGKLQVTYIVTEDPTMGVLQIKSELEGDFSWWNDASQFVQEDINEGRVRYFAARSTIRKSLKRDWVTLTAKCQNVLIEDIEFKIEIVLTTVQMVHNTGLALDLRRQGIIRSSNLTATVEHPLEASPMVIYSIVRKPAKGHLLMSSLGQLIEGSNFTQIDIDVGLIGYQVDEQVHSPFNDSFLFQVSVSNAQSSILRFNISYKPDTETLLVTNNGFVVEEGGSRVITSQDLYLVAGEITDFVYHVTRLPKHGELQLLDASESVVARRNITSFLNFDLESGTLQYQHDDSESQSDSFAIYAIATYVTNNGVKRMLNYTNSVDIIVHMRNDHKPEPAINRIFQVVRNGKTPLTDKYLKYTDDDIDFDDENIQYQRQRIPIGDLVSKTDNASVYHFTQRDLNEGNLIFKHQSNSLESRMVFFVFDTDRSRYNAGFLTIKASDPFLKVDTTSGLKLTRGGSTTISNTNLSIETNLGVKDQKITYIITTPPRYGIITIDGIPTSTFTHADLSEETILYNHDNSSNMLDYFNFTVKAKDQDADGWVRIRVFLEGHQRLPEVEHLKVLTLEEGTFAVIDKSRIKITHTNHLPAELIYHVTTSPVHGHLQVIKDLDETTNFGISERILRFTQQDVNRGYVYYVQTNTGFESDKFIFEVSTGFTRIANLTLNIDIAPKIVPVDVQGIMVLEGASKAITSDVIHIAHPFYENQPFEYYFLQRPAHGVVESTRHSGDSLSKFSTQDVANEFIYYVHDGSDTTQDSFVVTANSTNGDKASLPCVIQISITPINDRAPEITSSNSMTVYVGSTSTLTTDSLSAADPDTEAENLMYTLAPPSNGFLALKSKPTLSIRNFTQANLENEDVVFVHTGSRTGGFRFRVSDVIHFTQMELFTIIAKPLLISVVNNTGVKAAPGILQPITSQNLKVMPTEQTQTVLEHPITFTLTDGPHHGTVVRILDNGEIGTATFQSLSEFTQADIDTGIIGYQLSADSMALEDKFVFDVTLPLSQNLKGQEFTVDIVPADMIETTSLVTTKPMQTTPTLSPYKIVNRGVEVREGASITITDDHLQANNLLNHLAENDVERVILEYEIVKLPLHGYLLIGQRNLTRNTRFVQSDLDDTGIRYVHDHSDDRTDGFNFTVRVKAKEGSVIVSPDISSLTYKGEFKITVDPVNDQKFVVETTSLHMRVVQGTNKIISPKELRTIDPDNLPSEISYQLYGRPSNGKLALTSDPSVAVTQFTQEQIDNGDIIFMNNGGRKSGGFVFKITDGNSAHVQIKQFTIEVVPVTLSLFTEEVALPQGDKVVTISNSSLNVTTNGDRENVAYNITTFPRFGQIMVNHIPQLSFTQHDIDSNQVQYVQTELTMGGDFFRFTMYDAYNVVADLNVTIDVKPLIALEQLNATTGVYIPITAHYINASELAVKTHSDPTFKILSPPKRGLILNKTSRLAISQFSYSDLKISHVVYAADLLELESNVTLQDSFVFQYAANNAQPVQMTFDIEISARSATFRPTTPTRLRTRVRGNTPFQNNFTNVIDFPLFDVFPTTDPSSSGNKVGANSDPKTKTVDPPKLNSIVIIIPIVILIIIIFIIILIVLWKLNGKEKKNNSQQSTYPEPDIGPYPGSQPVPVQVGMMPPVNVTSIRPDHRQNGHIPTRVQSPMVPQVTVTALGRPPSPKMFNPVTSLVSLSSNGTTTLAYQYDSNCEQCDAEYMEQCRTASPTLKKSQYWV